VIWGKIRVALKELHGLGGAMECDLGSLVCRDPRQNRFLRLFLFVAVREYLPMFVRDVFAIVLYGLLHPCGVVGRYLGRKVPTGPMLDPWGESYIPAELVRKQKEAAQRARDFYDYVIKRVQQ
jgi:hypothetical protein